MDDVERAAVSLAIGRILRLASRPAQPGDIAQYEEARSLILKLVPEQSGLYTGPNWARDRLKGASGD